MKFLSTLRGIFTGNNSYRKASRMRRRLTSESLERRDLLAADITVTDGVLVIQGSDRPDTAEVSIENSRINVSASDGSSSVVRSFALAGIDSIVFHGEGGDDRFRNQTSIPSTAYGDAGDDYLAGGDVRDVLYGGEGEDRLYGMLGSDLLSAGFGDDYLDGGKGHDKIYGGDGNDRMTGRDGNDYLNGGAGSDRMYGADGNDRLYGLAGNDLLSAGSGNDYLDGGTGNDHLVGGNGHDRMTGRQGNDVLSGGNGNDFMYGTKGNDLLIGGAGNDYLSGGSGVDRLDGYAGRDRLFGGLGRDLLYVVARDDTVFGKGDRRVGKHLRVPAYKAPVKPGRHAIYLWRTATVGPAVPMTAKEAAKLGSFARSQGIGTVFYDNWGNGKFGSNVGRQTDSQLSSAIGTLHKSQLRVLALYTDTNRINDVVAYNRRQSAANQFDGIHINCERGCWPSGSNFSEPRSTADIELVARAVQAAKGLPVTWSISHHWDNVIVFRGVAKPAYQHIIDLVAGVDIQTAADSGVEIQTRVADEVAYARAKGKSFFVTVETSGSADRSQSFYDEGIGPMRRELQKIRFAGVGSVPFAYHHYKAYFGSTAYAHWQV